MFEKLVKFLEGKLGAIYADATKGLDKDQTPELSECVHIEYPTNMSMAKIASVVVQATAEFGEHFWFEYHCRSIRIFPRHGYEFKE
jgi:hypothetical protein